MEENRKPKFANEEIEIFEGRFQATKDEIANVVDNFIKNHDFGGIEFIDFVIGWQDFRRMYYGTRKEITAQIPTTITLGYLEVTPLQRLSENVNRVRVVCVWPPLLKYWEELGQVIHKLFSPSEKNFQDTGEEQHSGLPFKNSNKEISDCATIFL